MPDLAFFLTSRDLGDLHRLAEFWGIELGPADERQARQQLLQAMLDREQVLEAIEELPDPALSAMGDLIHHGGRLPWALFLRRYGELRVMGPGRRDRERPHLRPNSITETLWYRGLLGRAFLEGDSGPQEFAYLPEEWLDFIRPVVNKKEEPLGRPATPAERAHAHLVTDQILDSACSLLAAIRTGLPEEAAFMRQGTQPEPLGPTPLKALLKCAGLLDENGMPAPEPVREFLETQRGQALAFLVLAWLKCSSFNELRQLPGLLMEGDWQNETIRTRRAVLAFLGRLPESTWWSLPALVAAVRESQPDFQRPAGDYDSWFISERESGRFLRGFEHWEAVDGALLRYMICGPMHWLGLVDLAEASPGSGVRAFRKTAWYQPLLEGHIPEGLDGEDVELVVRSDARLFAPRRLARTARYQVARFCQWEGEDEAGFHYRITPSSLERARHQGLRVGHLLSLLRRYARVVPPSLTKALESWDQMGSQARFETLMVLRLNSPEALQQLRGSRAARFLGDQLGPTAVIVKPGAWKKVAAALAEMGILVEGEGGEEN